MNSKWLGFLTALLPLQLSAAVIGEKPPFLGANFMLISRPDNQQMADYFTPTVSAHVASVKWWGSFMPAGPNHPQHDYSIRFFKDVNGTPSNTPLFAATVTSPAQMVANVAGGQPIYSFQATLPTPLTLLENERVWVSILDMSASANSEFR